MGLFDGLLGNATQNNNETAEKLRDVLIPNEKVDMVFHFSKRFNCLYR